MARNSIIPSLTAEEQQVLALCGITQDEQLAHIGPRALLREIEAASPFFPEELENFRPDIARLETICRQAAGLSQMSSSETSSLWQDSPLPREEEPQQKRFSAATGRMLVDDHRHAKKAEMMDENRRKSDPRDFSHSIRCAHPVAIYLNAWFTLFLVATAVTLMLIVAGLLIGIEYEGKHGLILAAIMICVVLGYAFLLSMATCSTCRISVFSFRRYPRHRKAHHIPFIGYTIATALYTIFFFRFRCPSCGTPQKFFGKRHHRSRHRR